MSAMVPGGHHVAKACVCGKETVTATPDQTIINLKQTVAGVTEPQKDVSADGIYTYISGQNDFIVDTSDVDTAPSCGAVTVQFYKDQQGTLLQDTRL